MGSAEEVCALCPVKDMVGVLAWTAMVTAYAQNAMPVKALEPFEQMEVAGMPIDEASLTGAICSARCG
jgi:pentatricopeptide repeat protein